MKFYGKGKPADAKSQGLTIWRYAQRSFVRNVADIIRGNRLFKLPEILVIAPLLAHHCETKQGYQRLTHMTVGECGSPGSVAAICFCLCVLLWRKGGALYGLAAAVTLAT